MDINYGTILAYAIGIIILFIMGRMLLVPMKVILKLVYNALLGALVLIAINLVGSIVGFHIPLNLVTAFILGLLGIPGLVLLIILKIMFNF